MAVAQRIITGNIQPQLNNMTVASPLGNRGASRDASNQERAQLNIITDNSVGNLNARLTTRFKIPVINVV